MNPRHVDRVRRNRPATAVAVWCSSICHSRYTMDTTTLHDTQQAKEARASGALRGLHHVTAITASAAENVRFYTRTLGMRLTKKSVNQDDVTAYHLFYGDAVASPGSELTFFDWTHAAPRRRGPGTVASTGLRVGSEQALEWWA